MTAKASIFTHGCRLNQADSALIADDLRQSGYEIAPWGSDAEILIINSCVVTSKAAQKARQTTRAARRRNPQAIIVFTGCGAEIQDDQRDNGRVIDVVVPNSDKRRIPSILKGLFSPDSNEEIAGKPEVSSVATFSEPGCGYYANRTRANIKIQEGCDSFCSYCIVPYTRGKPRSRQWDDIIRETQILISRGHRELVLTGVNIALYDDNGRTLTDLLYRLHEMSENFRIRLSSTEPCDELISITEAVADLPRVCRFLHIPMQHGSDKILRRMNRRYTVKDCSRFIKYAADKLPDVCIGSDIIVGFPGETEAAFQECLKNIQSLPLAYLHIFRYSPRPGTPAANYTDPVDGTTASRRRQKLEDTAQNMTNTFTGSMKNKKFQILTEHKNDEGSWEGWTDNYLRAELPAGFTGIECNQFIEVVATEIKSDRHIVVRPVTAQRVFHEPPTL